jgi:hypothetical protein
VGANLCNHSTVIDVEDADLAEDGRGNRETGPQPHGREALPCLGFRVWGVGFKDCLRIARRTRDLTAVKTPPSSKLRV